MHTTPARERVKAAARVRRIEENDRRQRRAEAGAPAYAALQAWEWSLVDGRDVALRHAAHALEVATFLRTTRGYGWRALVAEQVDRAAALRRAVAAGRLGTPALQPIGAQSLHGSVASLRATLAAVNVSVELAPRMVTTPRGSDARRYLKRPTVGTRIQHATGAATVERVHDRRGLTLVVRDRIGRTFEVTRDLDGWWLRA